MSNRIPFRERIGCTPKEACAATGWGLTFLYDEIKTGRVESTKVRGKRVILVRSLLRRIEGDTAKAA